MRLVAALPALVALAPTATAHARMVASIPSADLAQVSARGAQLCAYDQAAWHATDAMLAALPKEVTRAVRGWIVEPAAGVLRVTYYRLKGGAPCAIYIADFADATVRNGHAASTTDRTVSPLGQRMVAAGDAALARKVAACVDHPFNAVVLLPDARGTSPVYLLTPMTQKGAYPFGGHHEVDTDSSGQVVATRDFTRSCLTIADPDTALDKTAALYVTHLLDPHPTEIHV